MDTLFNSGIPGLIYEALKGIGFPHPIHPVFAHIPVGLTVGGFLFLLAARLFKRGGLFQTARHCMVLTLIIFPFTVFFGWVDWVHFYGGALLFPFQMKLVLAGFFLVFLLWGTFRAIRSSTSPGKLLFINFLTLLVVTGLGFFGGELVYGDKAETKPFTAAESDEPSPEGEELVNQGAALFNDKCAMCHFADSTATRVGPGLKGLFEGDILPASGRKVSEANIRFQLRNPYRDMPTFKGLTERQVDGLIAYLKTL